MVTRQCQRNSPEEYIGEYITLIQKNWIYNHKKNKTKQNNKKQNKNKKTQTMYIFYGVYFVHFSVYRSL